MSQLRRTARRSTRTATTAHLLHDAGLAVWFGGTLMGAVGVNGASGDLDDPGQRARAASDAWSRWTPVNAIAIGSHLLGGALLLKENKARVANQKGVKANTIAKLGLTGGALLATAYARTLGQRVIQAGDVPVASGTAPLDSTPPDVAGAQRQLKALQWAIPGLTGAIMASSALHEEQQRPVQVLKGTLATVGTKAGDRASGVLTSAGSAVSTAGSAVSSVAEKVAEKAAERATELRSA